MSRPETRRRPPGKSHNSSTLVQSSIMTFVRPTAARSMLSHPTPPSPTMPASTPPAPSAGNPLPAPLIGMLPSKATIDHDNDSSQTASPLRNSPTSIRPGSSEFDEQQATPENPSSPGGARTQPARRMSLRHRNHPSEGAGESLPSVPDIANDQGAQMNLRKRKQTNERSDESSCAASSSHDPSPPHSSPNCCSLCSPSSCLHSRQTNQEYTRTLSTGLQGSPSRENSRIVENICEEENGVSEAPDHDNQEVRRPTSERDWIPGSVDIRPLAAEICMLLSQCYRLRWRSQVDRHVTRHWKRVADKLDLMDPAVPDHQLVSRQRIEALISHNGIGPNTISVLLEIYETGYLMLLEDIYAEAVDILGPEGRRGESGMTVAEVRQRIDTLGHGLEERRAQRRAEALVRAELQAQERSRQEQEQRAAMTTSNSASGSWVHSSNVPTMLGVLMTGTERKRLMWQQQIDHQDPNRAMQASAVSTRSTRSSVKKQRILTALNGISTTEDGCTICIGDYEDHEDLYLFECRHCFHYKCIQEWYEDRVKNRLAPDCPLCRRVFSFS